MRILLAILGCCVTLVAQEAVAPASDDYPLQADSIAKPGVQAGKTFEFEMTDSKIFPETSRKISVYVPAEYKRGKPACVYVGLDGLSFRVPTVFDNLIAQHEMPVTIAIGVSPGTVESARAPENPRFDRSFEFDSMNDRLARFLIDEVLPEVEKRGDVQLSKNPNDRAIGGGSTGAIAAFNVAWQRPDQFRRVFSAIGTFVGMRGGERFYVLVRKTEPKPLRIFMQDGAHDEWGGGPEMGDWWMSNQTMERALAFAGYDVRHVWGNGTHSGKHAEAIFPDAMRWLWRDWPTPIAAQAPGNPVLKAILQEGEDWNPAGEVCGSLAATLAQGAQTPCTRAHDVEAASGNGARLYFGAEEAKILGDGRRVLAMAVRQSGDLYVTAENAEGEGEVWLIRASGEKQLLDHGLQGPDGIAFSPDGLWMMVAQSRSRWGLSYRVRTDGTLDAREQFYDFGSASEAGELWMDRDGRAYAATDAGVQVFDRNGRVAAILPLPSHEPVTALSFGGPDFRTLYVVSGGRIYSRKFRVAGAPSWMPPITLPAWGPG